jgi:hypothetical protein
MLSKDSGKAEPNIGLIRTGMVRYPARFDLSRL